MSQNLKKLPLENVLLLKQRETISVTTAIMNRVCGYYKTHNKPPNFITLGRKELTELKSRKQWAYMRDLDEFNLDKAEILTYTTPFGTMTVVECNYDTFLKVGYLE